MPSASPVHPLYDATFTLHRVTPLHLPVAPPLLSRHALALHSRRLLDALTGHVLCDVHMGSPNRDRDLTRAGALKECRWSRLQPSQKPRSTVADGLDQTDGLQLRIEYERATYKALLLRAGGRAEADPPGELHLPVLFTRMPSGTREILLEYLATAFDVRVEPLRLSDVFIADTLELLLDEMTGDDGTGRLVGDVQFVLGFKAPVATTLRSLDITIRKEDLAEFMKRGKAIKSTPTNAMEIAGGKRKRPDTEQGPFLTALSQYLSDQLALDITHDQVFISRVACAAFVLGREGKVKLKAPLACRPETGDASSPSVVASRRVVPQIIQRLSDEARRRKCDSGAGGRTFAPDSKSPSGSSIHGMSPAPSDT